MQFRGMTAECLAPPRGKASVDVLKMAGEGLMLPLPGALKKAQKNGRPVRREKVVVRASGNTRTIDLEVIPLRNVKERFYLVLFEEAGSA